MAKPVLNIAEAPLMERGHGEQFAVKLARMGAAIGLEGLGCMLHIVPPGKRAFPFHAHHVADELFFILSGEGEYRYGGETYPVKAGDVVAAPAGGPAHQLINSGSAELRYLGISTNGGADVVEYPDSKKFAILAGMTAGNPMSAKFRHVGRAGNSLDYWDGEEG
jgi:uncharacterized cupin superfamily protein